MASHKTRASKVSLNPKPQNCVRYHDMVMIMIIMISTYFSHILSCILTCVLILILILHSSFFIFRYEIITEGISSDGDPKLLAAMIHEASLHKSSSQENEWENHGENGIITTQDTVHLGAKGRNRMLKKDIKLPMGKKNATIDHLKKMLRTVPKHVHGLSHIDVFPIDRMNFTSFEKIIKDRVIFALKEHIVDSEATVRYLCIFRDIVNSFNNCDLMPLDRIFLIYRSCYFLRIWRHFISSSHSYTLKENFITYNAYMCAEINAFSLLRLIKKFRDQNSPEKFLPTLFNSQGCENLFRLFRSMGTTQFTRINFTLLDLIHMIGRIECQNEIAYCKLNVGGIFLPHKRSDKTTIYELPNDEQISNILEKAKSEALSFASDLGMNLELDQNHNEFFGEFIFKSSVTFEREDHGEDDDHYDNEDLFDSIIDPFDECELRCEHGCEEGCEHGCHDEYEARKLANMHQHHGQQNHDHDHDSNELNADPRSTSLLFIDENGVTKSIPKTTFLWMVTEKDGKMTNDRIKRFRAKPY